MMIAMAVGSLALQAFGTMQANKAAKKEISARREQAEIQMVAEQRSEAFKKIERERMVERQLGTNRALLGAFGVSTVPGTTSSKLLLDTAKAGAIASLTSAEQTKRNIFAIGSTFENRARSIGEGVRQRNFALLTSAFTTAGSVAGSFGGSGSSTSGTPYTPQLKSQFA